MSAVMQIILFILQDGGVTWTQSLALQMSDRDATLRCKTAILYMGGNYYSYFKSTNDRKHRAILL